MVRVVLHLPLPYILSYSLFAHSSSLSLNAIMLFNGEKGRLNHNYAAALFHLFNEDTQYAINYWLTLLLRDGPGEI